MHAATPSAGSNSATPTRASETPETTSTWYHASLIRAAFPPEARRACVLVASALTFFLACGGAPERRPAPQPAPEPSSPPLAPWPPFAETMRLPPVTEKPIRVQGHPDAPPYAVIRVSASARDAYLSLVTDTELAADAVVAMSHQASEDGALGATYVMERRARVWRYLVLDPDGRIQREGPAECAGCHASGVAEGLFGPPRPKASVAPPRE